MTNYTFGSGWEVQYQLEQFLPECADEIEDYSSWLEHKDERKKVISILGLALSKKLSPAEYVSAWEGVNQDDLRNHFGIEDMSVIEVSREFLRQYCASRRYIREVAVLSNDFNLMDGPGLLWWALFNPRATFFMVLIWGASLYGVLTGAYQSNLDGAIAARLADLTGIVFTIIICVLEGIVIAQWIGDAASSVAQWILASPQMASSVAAFIKDWNAPDRIAKRATRRAELKQRVAAKQEKRQNLLRDSKLRYFFYQFEYAGAVLMSAVLCIFISLAAIQVQIWGLAVFGILCTVFMGTGFPLLAYEVKQDFDAVKQSKPNPARATQ